VNRLVWLASYPKSGNTWLRALLANFDSARDTPVSINGLTGIDAASRNLFDEALGLESSDMTHEEIERHRPVAYRQIAASAQERLFCKIHDAYTFLPDGEPLVPADASQNAVYMARNPLDVAISFAHHSGWTLDGCIDRMADEAFAFSSKPERLSPNLKQRLLSWSSHVLSWLDQGAIPVHLMRYEDTREAPLKAFTSALKFLGNDPDAQQVLRAIEFSSFDVLRGQERVSGFRERPATAISFFRRGMVDEWREVLTGRQVARIVKDHGVVMQRLGYLSRDGIPVTLLPIS